MYGTGMSGFTAYGAVTRLHSVQRLMVGLVLVTLPVLAASSPALAYPNATIVNQTRNPVTGTIYSAGCRSDNFSVPAGSRAANGDITATEVTISARRGACLITKIEASEVGLGPAFPYTSSGTAKSRFTIFHNENGLVVGAD
jgi:hypothetical protein